MASNTFVKNIETELLDFLFNGVQVSTGPLNNLQNNPRSIGLFYHAWTVGVNNTYDEDGSHYEVSPVASQYLPATNTFATQAVLEPVTATDYGRQLITFGTVVTGNAATAGGTAQASTPSQVSNSGADVEFLPAASDYFALGHLQNGQSYPANTEASGIGRVCGWAVFAHTSGSPNTALSLGGEYPIITGKFTTQKAILQNDQAKIASGNLTITLD